MDKKIGIVIQARMSSTRMPNKIMLPFYEGETIIDIITNMVGRMKLPSVIATTTNSKDDVIFDYCKQKMIQCYRGDEQDVLSRFIGCAKEYGFDSIIRICSDNPFLDEKELMRLIDQAINSDSDYIGFDIAGTPSIKTHFGFWGEYVTLSALEQVCAHTSESLYHEHVTNFIYSHPESFKISWLNVSESVLRRSDIRLTIDTSDDFANASEIYKAVREKNINFGIENVMSFLDDNPAYFEKMQVEIIKNSK